ncbi:aspartic proteinase-like protein 2 [Phtheirospermum japonicum]|uniref:Aspartic proteinase-like protein 2 n=1 Tax=Phtheirospermum japonicum TaxID=374723 RepID=A0A830CEG9_9LAMI|nr:aspartic proteinase-like protein 2 [Phtheirospermum japonicum]
MIFRHISCRLGLGSIWRHDSLRGGELSNNLINASQKLSRDAKEYSGRFSSLLSSSSSPHVGFSRSSSRLSFQDDLEFSCPFIVDDVDPPDSQTREVEKQKGPPSEEEVEKHFSVFGDITEVHLVVDTDTKRSKGSAYVVYVLPESAARTNNFTQQPSKTFKQLRNDERKASESKGDTRGWNSLFMRTDTDSLGINTPHNLTESNFEDPGREIEGLSGSNIYVRPAGHICPSSNNTVTFKRQAGQWAGLGPKMRSTFPQPPPGHSCAVAQPASSRLFNTNAVREYDSDDRDVDVDRRPDLRVFSPFAESPHGAREEVLQLASKRGINISVGLAYQSSVSEIGVENQLKYAVGVRFLGTIYCFPLSLYSFPSANVITLCQIDTGSDVLWVRCNACTGCPTSSGLQIDLEFFDPSSSSTASLISCSDQRCALGTQSSDSGCSDQNQCGYTFQYGDGSGTSGFYMDLMKPDRAVDGIFGFGQQGLSVISQLSSQGITPNAFSHCLKGEDGGGGILVLGTLAYFAEEAYDPFVDAIT